MRAKSEPRHREAVPAPGEPGRRAFVESDAFARALEAHAEDAVRAALAEHRRGGRLPRRRGARARGAVTVD